MAIRIVTPPAVEPITLDEAKDQLRRLDNEEDILISHYIAAARADCEIDQKRAYVTQTILYTLDQWPSRPRICLPRAPLQSVAADGVRYRDRDGNMHTFDAANYMVNANEEPGMIVLNPDSQWPTTQLYPYGAIEITFVAGYGDTGANVPVTVKQAILFLVAHYVENREEVAGRGHIPQIMPRAARSILAKTPFSWTEELNR